MKPELKELLLEIKTKINNYKLFRNFVGEIVNEANYNNYYKQSVVNEEIAEQLVEIYFIKNDSSNEEFSLLKEKIIKILFFFDGQEELIKEYNYFVETKVSKIVTELN